MDILPTPFGKNKNRSICTLYFKENVNSLCRNKVFKQTAESVNVLVSFFFFVSRPAKIISTYNVCVL